MTYPIDWLKQETLLPMRPILQNISVMGWKQCTVGLMVFLEGETSSRSPMQLFVFIIAGPLIIELPWAKNVVSIGALGALDNLLSVQTKI